MGREPRSYQITVHRALSYSSRSMAYRILTKVPEKRSCSSQCIKYADVHPSALNTLMFAKVHTLCSSQCMEFFHLHLSAQNTFVFLVVHETHPQFTTIRETRSYSPQCAKHVRIHHNARNTLIYSPKCVKNAHSPPECMKTLMLSIVFNIRRCSPQCMKYVHVHHKTGHSLIFTKGNKLR